MSGHSKWKTIKHKKGLADAKRGQAFTKIAKIITIAAKEGGGDVESNFKLRLSIEKAREVNMPKDNIQRAIDRGTGKSSENIDFKEVLYEGFGPENTAIMVETITDNTNRTNAELRSIFSKNGGSLVGLGSVAYLFDRVGYLFVPISEKSLQEEKILELMEIIGVVDVEGDSEGIEIYTKDDKFAEVRKIIKEKGISFERDEIIYRPKSYIKILDKLKAEKMIEFIELIEDHDDVQKVFHNIDIQDEVLN